MRSCFCVDPQGPAKEVSYIAYEPQSLYPSFSEAIESHYTELDQSDFTHKRQLFCTLITVRMFESRLQRDKV
jgi:hypothetical protein